MNKKTKGLEYCCVILDKKDAAQAAIKSLSQQQLLLAPLRCLPN